MPSPVAPEVPVFDPPIHLTKSNATGKWTRYLAVFARVVAALMLLKGLSHWSALCGIGDGAGASFETMPLSLRVITVFFAVIDLVAGVGLWLLADWGVAVWVIASVSQLFIGIWFGDVVPAAMLMMALHVALLAAYVGLRVMVLREQR